MIYLARSLPFVLSLIGLAASASAAIPEEYFQAIRANDMAALNRLVPAGDIDKADARGVTPLHYAALQGNAQSLKILLDAGAHVNVQNLSGATPLLLAASSPEKVKLLLAKGADPKIASKMGRTPLMVAAGRQGLAATVQALLEAGADLNATDVRGGDAMGDASSSGGIETVKLLLAKGAKADQADKAGFTPLIHAIGTGDTEMVKMLLARGANVNAANTFAGMVMKGPVALTKMTALILAAERGSPEMVSALIKAGAKVNAQDSRGVTPLIAAVASEHQDIRVIKLLIASGADVNAVDPQTARSVLGWARLFGYPATLKALEAAGAKSGNPESMVAKAPVRSAGLAANDPGKATEQAMGLLAKSSAQFFKETGCVGCHHQSMAARAAGAMQSRNSESAKLAMAEMGRGVTALNPDQAGWAQFVDRGGDVDALGNTLLGCSAAGLPANGYTDSAIHYIAGRQNLNGSWGLEGIARVPVEWSSITTTAEAIRAMQVYGWEARKAEFDEQIARARVWLLKAEPRTSYERADQLLALHWSGASPAELAHVAKALLKDRRPDGGWGQNPYLESDAYATGLALTALRESGQLPVSSAAYQKGVKFLLRTQLDDGSWYVRSRAPKFQPYFQSGFPHDHDQWISASGTAWAVMAIAPAVDGAKVARRE